MLQAMQRLVSLQFACQSDRNQTDRILLPRCQWTISWFPETKDRKILSKENCRSGEPCPELENWWILYRYECVLVLPRNELRRLTKKEIVPLLKGIHGPFI